MKNTIGILTVICSLLVEGCATDNAQPARLPAVPKLTANYTQIQKDVSEVRAKTSALSSRIEAQAERIKTAIECSSETNRVFPSIEGAAEGIQASTVTLSENAEKLDAVISETSKNQVEMETIQEFLEEAALLEDEVNRLNQQVSALLDTANQAYQKIWMGIAALGAITVVAGVVMCFLKMARMGATVSVAGIVLSSLAFFMAKYAQFVALFGGILFLVIIYILIRMIHVKNRALSETVLTTEILKKKVNWQDVRDDVKKIQSRRTKKLIEEVRDKEVNR